MQISESTPSSTTAAHSAKISPLFHAPTAVDAPICESELYICFYSGHVPPKKNPVPASDPTNVTVKIFRNEIGNKI